MSRSKGSRPTLKTISALTGFAVPTVSRALHDAPDIAQSTKETVRRVASDIGYVPNRAGQYLRTGKTHSVALVISTELALEDHIGQIIASIAKTLWGTGIHLTVAPHSVGQYDMEPVRNVVEKGLADCVILTRTKPRDPRIAYLMRQKFPFVTYGRSDWREDHAYYDFDNGAFARLAVKALADADRRRLVLLAPQQDNTYVRDMVTGAQAMAGDLDLDLDVVLEAEARASEQTDASGFHLYLDTHPQVDGLVCASPAAALTGMVEAKRAGREIGVDLDVCFKYSHSALPQFKPEVFSVYENLEKAGEFLGRAAVHAIQHPKDAPMQRLDQPNPPRSTGSPGDEKS